MRTNSRNLRLPHYTLRTSYASPPKQHEVATDVFAVAMFIHPSKIFFVYAFIQTVLSERLLDFSWVWNIRELLQTGV